MKKFTQTSKKWNVTFCQKDNPTNVFTVTYSTESEYEKWVNLHKQDFDIEVEVELNISVRIAKGAYPDLVDVTDHDVTYTLEAFIPTRNDWVPIRSGLPTELAVNELLGQLKIIPQGPHNPATDFRVVRVVRDVGESLGDISKGTK